MKTANAQKKEKDLNRHIFNTGTFKGSHPTHVLTASPLKEPILQLVIIF